MSASSGSSAAPIEVGNKPHQPRNIQFPARFGIAQPTYRSFQAKWFDKFPWLHWDDRTESCFCHLCLKASQAGLLLTNTAESAFISTGFQNWKEAMRVMGRNEASGCHKEAVEKLIVLPATTTPVEEMLSSQLSRERKAAREPILLILRGVILIRITAGGAQN